MLACYAEQFSITELNYTWYQMPKAEAVERQRRMVPPHFLFAVKLTRTLTHEIDPEHWPRQAEAFREGIAPLVQSRQLSAVLIQLPPQFQRTLPNRKHLAALLDKLAGLPLAVEFRHDSWASDAVFAELERRKVTLVTVDAPRVSPTCFPAWMWSPTRSLFMSGFTAGTPNPGAPGTCSFSLTTITVRKSWKPGLLPRLNPWPIGPKNPFFSSTTMSGPRLRKTPVKWCCC